jgi:hypothetical protein
LVTDFSLGDKENIHLIQTSIMPLLRAIKKQGMIFKAYVAVKQLKLRVFKDFQKVLPKTLLGNFPQNKDRFRTRNIAVPLSHFRGKPGIFPAWSIVCAF